MAAPCWLPPPVTKTSTKSESSVALQTSGQLPDSNQQVHCRRADLEPGCGQQCLVWRGLNGHEQLIPVSQGQPPTSKLTPVFFPISPASSSSPNWFPSFPWSPRKSVPLHSLGFPCSSAGNACNEGDLGLIPGLGRSPGEEKGYPLQYSGLENSIDCIVHGVLKSQTQLIDFHYYHYIAWSSYPAVGEASPCISLSLWFPLLQNKLRWLSPGFLSPVPCWDPAVYPEPSV